MVWLSLVTWLVVLMLVLPAGGSLLPSLGLLVMLAFVGFGATVVFAVTGADVWAWISFGAACLASVVGVVGARTLIYEDAQILQSVPDLIKNVAALALGVGLPILAATVLITLGTAVPA